MFDFKVKTLDKVVEVELKGRLDATVAPNLFKEMEKLQGREIEQIIIRVKELDYIASAGLRGIIFSKQKLGQNAEVIMDGANEMVRSVIELTGCENFVTLI